MKKLLTALAFCGLFVGAQAADAGAPAGRRASRFSPVVDAPDIAVDEEELAAAVAKATKAAIAAIAARPRTTFDSITRIASPLMVDAVTQQAPARSSFFNKAMVPKTMIVAALVAFTAGAVRRCFQDTMMRVTPIFFENSRMCRLATGSTTALMIFGGLYLSRPYLQMLAARGVKSLKYMFGMSPAQKVERALDKYEKAIQRAKTDDATQQAYNQLEADLARSDLSPQQIQRILRLDDLSAAQ